MPNVFYTEYMSKFFCLINRLFIQSPFTQSQAAYTTIPNNYNLNMTAKYGNNSATDGCEIFR